MQLLTENVLVAMRRVRAQSDRLNRLAQECSPRGGAIPIGSEHVRYAGRADALATLLSKLAKGYSLDAAATVAKQTAKEWASKWNARREYQVAISDGFCDSDIDAAVSWLRKADEN